MSELHIGLIALGVVVIGGVWAFNLYQQRRYQSRAEADFRREHEDVLLAPARRGSEGEAAAAAPTPATEAAGRIEPGLGDVAATEPEDRTMSQEEAGDHAREDVDYRAEIRGKPAVAGDVLQPFLQRRVDFGRPVTWLGRSPDGGWEEVRGEAGATYSAVRVTLQLVDRSGPVSEVKLAEFRDMVQLAAQAAGAEADCPDAQQAHAAAALLDQFCAEVDVMIGLNVVAKDGGGFPGTKIRALAEASGFRLEPDGSFKLRDDEGRTLVSLSSQDGAPFSAEGMRTHVSRGLTLLLDVPRTPHADRVLGQMADIGRSFATKLGGTLVDDNRVPVTDPGLAKIRTQVAAVQARMAAQGIPAGSGLALRIFA